MKNTLKNIDKKIYLETNGTLYENLKQIIDYIEIISMDIKLPSSTKMPDMFDIHKKFIETSAEKNKEIFLKVVFDENITREEIIKTVNLAKSHNLLIVLQPKTDGEVLNLKSDFISSVFYKYIEIYKNIRLIPQVHKFINIR